MSKTVKTRRGKEITLLNPAEKGRKFATELGMNLKITNDGVIKTDKNGDCLLLNETQRAYRAGYLDARQDSANCFNAQQGRPKTKRSRRSRNLPSVR